MNKLDIVKKSVSVVISFGVGNIVKQIIDNNTEEPDNAAIKVANTAGAFAIGAAVAGAVSAHTDAEIDKIAASFNDSTRNIKLAMQKD